jgi:predicted outer membrane protein
MTGAPPDDGNVFQPDTRWPAPRVFLDAMKQPYPTRSSIIRAACATALVSLAALSATARVEPTPTLPPPAQAGEPLPAEGYKATDAAPIPHRKTEQFISKVSMLNSEEARISSIATQRTISESVRTFAEQLRNANQARDQELAQIAQSRSVVLPTGRDANDLADENEEWQKKDAKDFDEDYVKRVIKIQKNSIDTLEDYAKDNDSDPELASFAQKHLPGLRESLRQAEALEKQVD